MQGKGEVIIGFV